MRHFLFPFFAAFVVALAPARAWSSGEQGPDSGFQAVSGSQPAPAPTISELAEATRDPDLQYPGGKARRDRL